MNELLLAYFDRPLSGEESTELSALLERDPVAAQDFAKLAKADVALERHFNEAQKAETLDSVEAAIRRHAVRPHKRNRPTVGQFAGWAAVAAVLALLGLVVAQLVNKPDRPPANARQAFNWTIAEPPVVPGGESVRFAEGIGREEKRAAARLRARLTQFYLPSVSIRGMTLDAALGEIEKAMVKSDHRGWLEEEPVGLTMAGADPDTEGKIVTLIKENLSAIDALELLAIQAGKQLVFHASGIELSDYSEDPNAPVLTRTFSIPQERFNGQGPYLQERNTGVTLEVDPVVGSEGFTIDLSIAPEVAEFEGFVNYGSPITLEDRTVFQGVPHQVEIRNSTIINPIFSTRKVVTPTSQLENWGVSLTGNSSAEWVGEDRDPGGRQLVVTAGLETMDRIATLLNAVSDESAGSALVTVETKTFEVPEVMVMEATLLDAAEHRRLVEGLNGNREVVSIAYPSVATRNAQRVLVESVTEQSVSTSGDGTIIDRTGSALDVVPTFDGELIRITGSVDLGFVPESDDAALVSEASRIHPESPVVHHTVDFDAHIGPEEVALFSIPGTKLGKAVIYVIEATRN